MVDTAAGDGEDPRWRRSSTDCVSFLAFRFACTKGTNCEFRHCEGARFSPSCWYWFQGNCVNPSFTFRHPPLESLNQTKPLADPLPSYSSASVKAASPCYFYYNSYCKKGGNCPFLHEPPTFNNVVGTCSGATTSNIAVHGITAVEEKIESSKCAPANPYQGSPEHIKKHHSKGVSESSSPVFNGATSNAPETSADTVGYMKSSTPSDRSSGDSGMEHAEHMQNKTNHVIPPLDLMCLWMMDSWTRLILSINWHRKETLRTLRLDTYQSKDLRGEEVQRARMVTLRDVVFKNPGMVEEIEQRPTHHMQNSLMGDCSHSLVCATFRGQKKKSRRKQQHARSARSSNYTNANANHLNSPEDFKGPKSLAQIKEEKCRSRSSISHPTVHVAHRRQV
ncbi:zinc finger CCCH domain-containing protein 34-like [Panicum miliaceum]|uniref:Zinc finger CCCH domain-containing protein 34-like n=1 Tax=Panicum miliaceum TaxID=4540 RepID=A0A3L6R7A1_PANMI|nr:zinc finger CCCH domain-containing protein 34-like [Panicum miliaceum]